MKTRLQSWPGGLLSSLSITGIVILARLLGFLQPLEWRALDLGLRWRPAEETDTRLTIVEITEKDIQTALSYPIADDVLADLLKTVEAYEPRVIGVDIFRDIPVGDGAQALSEVLQSNENIVGINKIEGQTDVKPHLALPEEQVGFADAFVDDDGYLRRSWLAQEDAAGNYRFSLTIRLAEKYLAAEALILENGIKDPETMRFGPVEIPRFQANTGGYVRADFGGNQTLINYRAGKVPFEKVSYSELVAGDVDPSLLRDRVVLVGYTAETIKDFVSSAAIAGSNPSLIPGIDVQAHAVSQILSAFYSGRPFLRSLPDAVEYLLILAAGLLGIGLAQWLRKPAWHWLLVMLLSSAWLLLCYGAIVASWWLPLVPVMAAFGLSAVGLYPLAQAKAQIQAQIEERKNLINWTYNTIHNGPLQVIAGMLSSWPVEGVAPATMRPELQRLNKELRDIYEAMRKEMLLPTGKLVMAGDRTIDLSLPLSELLYETYQNTLARQQQFFSAVVQITTFEPMAEQDLYPTQKRELARFLEEALLNVYKHGGAVTRLILECKVEGNENLIRVVDNGRGLAVEASEQKEADVAHRESRSETGGQSAYGTQQANRLAKGLGGTFERKSASPHGVCCELRWPKRATLLQRLQKALK